MISLELNTYTLSSALPDTFTTQTDAGEEYVEVDISLDGTSIYSTRLYANDAGDCTFYEFRQIVEQEMTSRNLCLASFEMHVYHTNGEEALEDKFIIFSRYRNAMAADTLGFLQSHFLVTRSFYVMPRGGYGSVPFFATADEEFSPYINCVFELDGNISHYRLENPLHHFDKPYVYYVSLSPMSVKARVDSAEGEDCGRLLSFSVHVGSRDLSVFVVDDVPCISFLFRNCYNAFELLHVFGTTTFKTEVSRKEAVAGGITSFYDKSVSRKWEVTTVPLSLEEAHWYNEFLESDCVVLELNNDFNDLRILVSDITSEISDSSKDKVCIKFSWRFEDNAVWIQE